MQILLEQETELTADVPSKHYSKAQPTHNAQGNWEPMLL